MKCLQCHNEFESKRETARFCSAKCRQSHWRMENTYGLSINELSSLIVEANGKCQICKAETSLVIDHDHKHGNPRGLLCVQCNFYIERIERDIKNLHLLHSVLKYLLNPPALRHVLSPHIWQFK